MKYETFDFNKHDVSKVAELTYDVDFRTFDMLYKSKESAVNQIAKDLPKRGLGDYFKVILDDNGEIIGMMMIYSSEVHHKFYLKPIRLLIVDILDHFVLADIEDEDLYLAEIAVDSRLRGQGIGKKVICDVIDYAKSKNYKRVILDADFIFDENDPNIQHTNNKPLFDSFETRYLKEKLSPNEIESDIDTNEIIEENIIHR